jgi:hypothetical protein
MSAAYFWWFVVAPVWLSLVFYFPIASDTWKDGISDFGKGGVLTALAGILNFLFGLTNLALPLVLGAVAATTHRKTRDQLSGWLISATGLFAYLVLAFVMSEMYWGLGK